MYEIMAASTTRSHLHEVFDALERHPLFCVPDDGRDYVILRYDGPSHLFGLAKAKLIKELVEEQKFVRDGETMNGGPRYVKWSHPIVGG